MNTKIVVVYDLETLINCFTYTALNINTKEIYQFVLHKDRDDRLELLHHLHNTKGQIGFNNLSFDSQIIQFFLNNSDYLITLPIEELITQLYSQAQKTIQLSNNNIFPEFPEWKLSIPNLDLFKIWHFDNKAKMSSLKWIEYSLDLNIQEMPIHHTSKIKSSDIKLILEYNLNDVLSTYELYKITIGDTNHPLYKGVNKVQLRKDIQSEFGIQCRNYNDVRIGDSLNKFKYCNIRGIKKNEVPKGSKDFPEMTFKDCFPEYTNFKTTEFNNFVNALKNEHIKKKSDSKQEYKFKFNETEYTIAKGGIHSNDKPRIIKPSENEILMDADIQSQYPNKIRKGGYYPKHLHSDWNTIYSQMIPDRLNAKKLFKETKNPKYQAIQEAYKLALNGVYGKLGEENSWLYSPETMYKVTIGNQIEILMLIEKLETNGIHCISANTDGIVCLFDKNLIGRYYELCKDWEKEVGNDILGNLEYTQYNLIVQTSVNDYLAVKTDGEIKTKGDFVTDFELHKDKSARVIPMALKAYFIDNITPEIFIPQCQNIFDFCCGAKAKGQGKFYLMDTKNSTEEELQKVIRYYISTDGKNIVKRLPPLNEKKITRQLDIFGNIDNGNRESEIEAGYLSTIMNTYIEVPIKERNINYQYYIDKAYKIINQIVK